MKPHEFLLGRLRAILEETPHGSIIIVAETPDGLENVELTTNIPLENQVMVLTVMLERAKHMLKGGSPETFLDRIQVARRRR
jgi:hypothetical protein